LAAMEERGEEDEILVAHVEEELGDVLFQVIFHAELGDEEGRFSFATIADAVRDKLTERHPHVFGDVVLNDASDVEANWEAIKKVEKGRTSTLDGVAWDLPALVLLQKIERKGRKLGVVPSTEGLSPELGDLIAIVQRASDLGVDLEESVRAVALSLAQQIRTAEGSVEI